MQRAVALDWPRATAILAKSCTDRKLSLNSTPQSVEDLCQIALLPEYTLLVLHAFKPLFLEVQAQWVLGDFSSDTANVFHALASTVSVLPQSNALVEHFLIRYADSLLDPEAPNLTILQAFYRILSHDRARYKDYISPEKLYMCMNSDVVAIRGLAVVLLAIYTEASEKTRRDWLQEYLGSEPDSIKFLALEEARRIAADSKFLATSPVYTKTMELPAANIVANIGGTLIPKIDPLPSRPCDFVATEGSVSTITKIASGLLENKPVLLVGPAGAGKTFYVDCLASQLRPSEDIVRIHLGDQTDAKSLIGTYSTGEKPGVFEWKAGILTVAVTKGRWVLIEDLDRAPTDVVSILLPLMEKRELMVSSRNQTFKAKAGFQIFATVTADDPERSLELIGQRLWHKVTVDSPSTTEFESILVNRFPRVAPLAAKFIETYHASQTIFANRMTQDRQLTSRDLFKWCQRVEALLERAVPSGDASTEVPVSVFDDIFREAVCCFASFLPDPATIRNMAELIGEHLEVPSSKIGPMLNRHLPTIHEEADTVQIGRATLPKRSISETTQRDLQLARQNFALTNHSLRLLEQIAVATSQQEPLLLVGETGTGKTTIVQYMANLANRKLVAVNISQQMETGDLVGGYKPVDAKQLAGELLEEFDELFDQSFSRTKNQQFCDVLGRAIAKSQWSNIVKLWREAHRMVKQQQTAATEPAKKKRKLSGQTLNDWAMFMKKVEDFDLKLKELNKAALFKFIEGLLVKAVRKGQWILLDEINLAPPDTLEGIADLLVSPPSITLLEKGDDDAVIKAHPEFRLFACMNPATDVGKKDLPPALRSRFTEIYVDTPDRDIDDLRFIIDKYIARFKLSDQHVVNDIAELFLKAKSLASDNQLVDGAGQRPHFSIRTLSRTLVYATTIARTYGLRRALYEGFCMSFLTLLDKPSAALLEPIIRQYTIDRLGNAKSVLATLPPAPTDGFEYIQFRHYWLRRGEFEPEEDDRYIITPSVEYNLLSLVRATATKSFPVLIQGPTSSGKTSMINYLAKRTGHKFVRINNHEHTDLQEYLGSYSSDDQGNLVFREGVLVEAVRKGYWIVLDELNLAPTDVLEALNRLLDDNRELLIPETQEIIKPHPDFMLFATQNPPGLYAGRKILSRAFRNRFLELHFDDIPQDELEQILKDRCQIAPSYAKKIVDAYRELARQRQSTRVFEQKNGFATLRDLFRWAMRPAVGYEQLALNGYLLLAERVRNASEKKIVRETLEKVMRVKLEIDYKAIAPAEIMAQSTNVVWTSAMKRLLVLVLEAMKQNEPILLVGETGCGKTTIFQVLSSVFGRKLHIVNAHQNTETGDIIGAQRPLRNRSEIVHELETALRSLYADEKSTLNSLKQRFQNDNELSPEQKQSVQPLLDRSEVLFEWSDGSLVTSMKEGSFFLIDEISLADDSVLERLNSVLEPERGLLLPEKGGTDIHLTAADNFQFFATMNPGGDYGKKELSPALRNRFTEIWVPSMDDFDDVELIVRQKLLEPVQQFARPIVEFSHWFAITYGNGDATSGVISLRDILCWTQFINSMPEAGVFSVFHGGCMVFVDSIGSNALAHLAQSADLLHEHRLRAVQKLAQVVNAPQAYVDAYFGSVNVSEGSTGVRVGEFTLPQKANAPVKEVFSLSAPTTAMNAMRVVRALVVNKPILLEGSPGVGKTSLVSALSALSGNKLVRINLSEQTDLIDLFGSDSPAEGDNAGEFVWRDAPFLRAMQVGEWVLLDEMNLASQAVLEGLNSCLDHRGEAYIPELDRTFKCHPEFKVFAAQNPQYQGGGRKGLPKSFVNRFSVVYVDVLSLEDLRIISKHLYPTVDAEAGEKMVDFIRHLDHEVSVNRSFGVTGGPYEFNLRDTMRWFSMVSEMNLPPKDFFDIIVRDRFRTPEDRSAATALFVEHFRESPERTIPFDITPDVLRAGHSLFERNGTIGQYFSSSVGHLQCNTRLMETAITCVKHSWPLILCGPTDSGKTSFLRYLGFVCGATTKEFSMSADIDSTDLLGEFDQLQEGQQLDRIWNEIDEYISQGIGRIGSNEIALLEASATRDLDRAVSLLPDATRVHRLVDEFRATDFSKPRFKWFDGALVQAVEKGYWLVLDNANLCSPSVLDRLNSLLEPNGLLLINECADANGEPRKVVPHPDFRLFLTLNPKYGELSRAMRNRGIEIYVDSLNTRATHFDRAILRLPRLVDAEPLTVSLETLSLTTEDPVSSKLPITDTLIRPVALYDDLGDLNSWLASSFVSKSSHSLVSSDLSLPYRLNDFEPYHELVHLNATGPVDLEPLNPLNGALVYKLKVFALMHQVQNGINRAIERTKSIAEKEMNLLELSIHSRTKDTINCVDVYGFISRMARADLTTITPELVELLSDFLSFISSADCDISKIPIFRDIFEEITESDPHVLSATSHLGAHYDFSDGGMSMEVIWKDFATGGFISRDLWSSYHKILSVARDFDDSASQFSPENIDQIVQVRTALSTLLVDVHKSPVPEDILLNVTQGVANIKESLKSSKGHEAQFVPLFRDLKSLLETAYLAKPEPSLLNSLTLLSYYSASPTSQLAEFYEKPAILPDINTSPVDIRRTIITALRHCDSIPSSHYETAMIELSSFTRILLQNSQLLDTLSNMTTFLQKLVLSLSASVDAKEFEKTLELLEEGDLGSAWIEFSSRILYLYVPRSVFDPAIRQHVRYERYTRRRVQYTEELEYWQKMRSIFVGDDLCGVDKQLLQQLVGLQSEPVPSVFRPKQSQIVALYHEINAAFPMLQPAHIAKLNYEQLQVWNGNTLRFLDRLEQFSGYQDLISILRGAVIGLQFGLNWKLSPSSNKSLYWILNANIVADARKFVDASKGYINAEKTLPQNVALHFLKLCNLHSYENVGTIIEHILKQFYHQYALEKIREEKEREQSDTIYKPLDEDDEAEKDFQRLFPDYDGEFLDEPSHPDVQVELSEAYTQIFSAHRSDMADMAIQSLRLLAKEESVSLESTRLALPSLFLGSVDKVNQAMSAEAFNFYVEPCYKEAKVAIALMKRVSTRISNFLERWPEHETLLIISNACTELANLAVSAPLARYLAKVEQIHHYLNEWQRFASKDVGVIDFIDEVGNLIVSWRRIELSTWPSLFEHELKANSQTASRFWFHLYENLVSNPIRLGADTLDLSEIVKLLVLFISDSSFGQFKYRMNMLTSVKTHLELLAQDYLFLSTVTNVIENVLNYYNRFASIISENMATKEKALKKEIQEVILLASWRDVNVLALKQSAQRSHRSLYKVVRKYRDFVSQKVSSLVEEAPALSPPLRQQSSRSVYRTDVILHLNELANTEETVQLWASRPRHLLDIKRRADTMQDWTNKVWDLEVENLRLIAEETVQAAEKLRKETPAELTEENKKLCMGLRNEKMQLLISVLKALKESGLRINVREDTAAAQSQLSQVLSVTPSLAGYSMERANTFFYGVVETMPRLRSNIASAETDVPIESLKRGLVFGENLLAMILRFRTRCEEVLRCDFSSAKTSLLQLHSLLESGDEMAVLSNAGEADIYLGTSKHLSQFVSSVYEAAGKTGSLTEVTEALRAVPSQEIPTKHWIEMVRGVQESLRTVSAKLIGLSDVDQLVAPVVSSVASNELELGLENKSSDIVALHDTAILVCNSILVAVQSVYKISQDEIPEEGWFTAGQVLLEKMAKSLHGETILSEVQRFITMASHFVSSRIASSYTGVIIAFLEGYLALREAVEQKLASHLTDTSKAAFELLRLLSSMSTQGFCSPQEPQKAEDEDTSKMEDGTGLGDGAGAQTTANNDEQDDDLTEQAQTENKEKEDDGPRDEEEDNAIEMEGDMAGDLEDADSKSDDEDDDKKDEDEEIDDEVGDIDDLDPNAIDEKMWDDQKDDDDLKEKQTDDVKGQSDELEAGDDNDDQQKPQENDSKDGNNDGDDVSDASDASDEEDVGEQDDHVQQDKDELEQNVDEGEALDLPEDMNLDGEDGQEEENGDDDVLPDLPEEEGEGDPDEDSNMQDEAEVDGDAEAQDTDIEADAEPEAEDGADGDMEPDSEAEGEPEGEPEPQPEEEEQAANMEQNDGGEGMDMEIDTEGLHGQEDNAEADAQQSTLTEQQSEQSGQGANTETKEEQENIDTGATAAVTADMDQSKSEEQDQAMKDATESLKELGDAMKEYHRRRQEIQERSEHSDEPQKESANIDADEVEHVGAEDQFDTQALGRSNQNERQDIDDTMAVDDEDEADEEALDEELKPQTDAEPSGGAGANLAADEDMELGENEIGAAGSRLRDHEDDDDDIEESKDVVVRSESEERELNEARELWRQYDLKTQDLSLILSEQLRLILEPTLATKLRGDYKTGKRLNMKRIIPYIASQFKKDKIWLRRTKPSQRQYQIMLSLDDSKSMAEPQVLDLAFQSIALVSKALSQIEAGQLSIVRFGEDAEVVHPFDKPFNTEAGAQALRHFTFNQDRTDVNRLLSRSLDVFAEARPSNENWQLEIIISDGICEDHENLRRLVRRAHDNHVMVVFIVLDALNKDGSILEMSQVNYSQDENGNMALQVDRYMDNFPFEYYVLVRDIAGLPGILASVLRQYLQAVDH